MLGLIYIFVCFFTGYTICTIAFPKLNQLTTKAYDGRDINISPYFVVLPAWYLTGTLCVTWATYFVAYLWGNSETPLKYANIIIMPLFFIVSLGCFLWNRITQGKITLGNRRESLNQNNPNRWNEIVFLILVTTLVSALMWITFFVKGDQLYVGSSVFSDFSPHLGMIRSFSVGNNFPTQYSHFAGEDIRYHFMFQFLVGNLEYLGLRLDYAFNIPSILSFITSFMLLYVIAIKLTRRKVAGYLTCLFFAFRSSESLFTYLSEIPRKTNIWQALTQNTDFIGYTPNESWGLWNLNVYCNQRHLAFSLSVMILIIIMFLPQLYSMFQLLCQTNGPVEGNYEEENRDTEHKQEPWYIRLSSYFHTLLLTKEGWVVKDWRLAITSGILLGSIAFWNGAALIAALTVLFIVSIFAQHRLEFLIMAVIATSLSILQAKFFIDGAAVSMQYYFGFISENKTLFGVADYLKKLLGILPIVLFAAFLMENRVKRYLMIAFSAPLVLAFTLSLTVDVTVNHKYIMIAVMFLGIFAADFLVELYEKHDTIVKIGCLLIILSLIGTGFYDFTTILRKNQSNTAIVLDLDDDLTKWIQNNSDSKDIFLSSNYALNRVVLGGAMLFQGWPYFAWSAGYDTVARNVQVNLMYEADTPEKLKELIEKNNIRFIIIDNDNRLSEAYELNEENINNTYAPVYQDGEGEWTTFVYDTEQYMN